MQMLIFGEGLIKGKLQILAITQLIQFSIPHLRETTKRWLSARRVYRNQRRKFQICVTPNIFRYIFECPRRTVTGQGLHQLRTDAHL